MSSPDLHFSARPADSGPETSVLPAVPGTDAAPAASGATAAPAAPAVEAPKPPPTSMGTTPAVARSAAPAAAPAAVKATAPKTAVDAASATQTVVAPAATEEAAATGAAATAASAGAAAAAPKVRRPAKAAGGVARNRSPRRARLQLRGINVWSALRFSVVIAIALFCVWMVMIGLLYGVLEGAGAIDKVNEAIEKINPDGPNEIVTTKMVFGGGVIIGAAYMVLFIAMTTIGSVIYNLCADLVGGVEVTLSERE